MTFGAIISLHNLGNPNKEVTFETLSGNLMARRQGKP